jgi:hypothetical protein
MKKYADPVAVKVERRRRRRWRWLVNGVEGDACGWVYVLMVSMKKRRAWRRKKRRKEGRSR